MTRKSKLWDKIESFKDKLLMLFVIVTTLSVIGGSVTGYVYSIHNYYTRSALFNEYKKKTNIRIWKLEKEVKKLKGEN